MQASSNAISNIFSATRRIQNHHDVVTITVVVFRVKESHLLWRKRWTFHSTILVLTLKMLVLDSDVESGRYLSGTQTWQLWKTWLRCSGIRGCCPSCTILLRMLNALRFLFPWLTLLDWGVALDTIYWKHNRPSVIWVEGFIEGTYVIILLMWLYLVMLVL